MPTTVHKRKFAHTTHGETRVKPDAPPKPLKQKYQRKVRDTGPRWVHVYTPLPRAEDYEVAIAWDWIFNEGME